MSVSGLAEVQKGVGTFRKLDRPIKEGKNRQYQETDD